MPVTGSETLVTQRFKKSAIAATTITLVPSTAHESEAKPTHLNATQMVITYAATPENMYGVVAASLGLEDEMEYEVTIRRLG
jgi:hypothetical protein